MIFNFINKFITLLTCPGVVIHEIAHRLFCDITGVPVYSICYFNLSSTSLGSVVHKTTYSLKRAFLISVGPLIVNSLLCVVLTMPYMISYDLVNGPVKIAYLILAWLGFSIGIHATPSMQDIKNVIVVLNRRSNKKLHNKIEVAVNILLSIHYLRYIGFDLFYAYILCKIVPFIIIH